MEKTITIGGKETRMRASALIPRLYRFKFGRDMVVDMKQLQQSYKRVLGNRANAETQDDKTEEFSSIDLTIFENVAWLMCKHADKDNVPDDPDEWLDSIDGVFSIYEVLPTVLELWTGNLVQTSQSRKK